MMKIAVLGSGILGVTTAYELAKRGHSVIVIERQPKSGAETSYANGGQLSYNHAEPWANPAVLPVLPKWMLSSDAPLVFRPRLDWQMMRWGLKFFRNCTPARARINCVNMLRLGLYSRSKMQALEQDTGINFDYSKKGILHIFSGDDEFDHAKRQCEFQAKFGGEERILSREECLQLEPALAHSPRHIIGGIHAFQDESGDAHTYCAELARIAAERYDVLFHYGVTVESLRTEDGRIANVQTDKGDVTADGYVMAMGSYSPLYLRTIGIDVPIYPMKGYSLTIEANEYCPELSLTDISAKIVYSRLGSRLRVAGTAEFAGYDTAINEKRIAPILKSARALLPKAGWDGDIGKWACLRPSTPSGCPILGPTPYRNLFLNTGHGTLGWTQGAGSAAIVADSIEGKRPEIMLDGLLLRR